MTRTLTTAAAAGFAAGFVIAPLAFVINAFAHTAKPDRIAAYPFHVTPRYTVNGRRKP